jgi:hypothetical protein
MAAKQHLGQLRKQIEKLRKDSLSVVTSANKIVYTGVQKLADRELKALNDYYRSALSSIKSANKSDLRGLAGQQLDLLQDTVNQVISHARESMSIVADTRAELAKLVQKGVDGEKVAVSTLNKTVAPAKKAVANAKKAAAKAGKEAEKTVKKTVKEAEKSVKKTVKQATGKARAATRKAVSSGKATAAAAVKKVEYAFPSPSPGSRASRATSRAKQAASVAVESVGNVVSNVTNAVAGAVDKVADAIKPQD